MNKCMLHTQRLLLFFDCFRKPVPLLRLKKKKTCLLQYKIDFLFFILIHSQANKKRDELAKKKKNKETLWHGSIVTNQTLLSVCISFFSFLHQSLYVVMSESGSRGSLKKEKVLIQKKNTSKKKK